MLVDQEHCDVLAISRETVERMLNRRRLRLLINYKEVFLGVGWCGDMLIVVS
jgi:hypothetical protein